MWISGKSGEWPIIYKAIFLNYFRYISDMGEVIAFETVVERLRTPNPGDLIVGGVYSRNGVLEKKFLGCVDSNIARSCVYHQFMEFSFNNEGMVDSVNFDPKMEFKHYENNEDQKEVALKLVSNKELQTMAMTLFELGKNADELFKSIDESQKNCKNGFKKIKEVDRLRLEGIFKKEKHDIRN